MAEGFGGSLGGRYRLIETIGEGAMGRVWRGHDDVLDREVAIKQILLPEGLIAEQRELRLQRFLREARAAARLNHPGIVTIHDVAEQEGMPFIVMELVRGCSLGAAIREQGRLSFTSVISIGAAMADALTEAHRAGIVHRDLKPDNVLLSGRRTIVTDFGLASLVDATALTTPGTLMGTPSYMAPEQIEGRPATGASDMWSLGATLYTAIEGRPPFTEETLSALFHAILNKSPRAPQHAGPLEPILATLLLKDPARRAANNHVADSLTDLHRRPETVPSHNPPRPVPRESRSAADPSANSVSTDRSLPRPPRLHPARVAWECGRIFVEAADCEAYEWLADRLASDLGPSYRELLAHTRDRIRLSEDARYAEAGIWRAHLDRLFTERPELVPYFNGLLARTSDQISGRK